MPKQLRRSSKKRKTQASSMDFLNNEITVENDGSRFENVTDNEIGVRTDLESVIAPSVTADEVEVINDQNLQNGDNANDEDEIIVENTNSSTVPVPVLLKINQVNVDIDHPWRIRALIDFKHPIKTYMNNTGSGEITTWDLIDETGSINFIAFNLQSNSFQNIFIVGRCYEINNLSIRTSDPMYKTLNNDYELIATANTLVDEVECDFEYTRQLNLIKLRDIENLPLNSIVDVNVRVLRDYGIRTGFSNENSWSRRELHIAEDGFQTRIILWNQFAKQISGSMINLNIQLRNIKIGWFNGSRNLATLPNSRLLRL